MESKIPTLMHLLRARRSSSLDVGLRFLPRGEVDEPTTDWSWADLDQRARAIGGRLQDLGLAGERALLLMPPGLDFVAAFFGCIYAGMVAVPAYPPDPTRLDATLPRLLGITRSARPAAVLTTAAIERVMESLTSHAPQLAVLEKVAVDAVDPRWADDWQAPPLTSESLAFLQYTSGSTGGPKGVMVSHGNLMANLAMIADDYRVGEGVVVSWLPPFHDMGLIGTIISPLHQDKPVVLMPPAAFIKRPLRWLRAIDHFGGTVAGGPDFAYALCARKATPKDVAGLDLRSWRVAFCGSEPVRAPTLRAFTRAFAEAGFDPRALYPTYGLAEATLLVTGGFASEHVPLACDAKMLARGRVAPGEGTELVGCGRPVRGTEVAILREDGRPAEPDEVGEIAVRGPAVAQGYWEQPDATAQTFGWRAGDGRTWLRTGDLGVLHAGSLHVTGRQRDLIIIRGRNHYPQDIEATVASAHPGVRPGGVAAFEVPEGLGVAVEVRDGVEPSEVEAAVRAAIAEHHQLSPAALALVAARTIPKTSSGKLRRQATRAAWLDGALPLVRRAEHVTASSGLPAWLVDPLVSEAELPRERITPEATLQGLGLDSLAIVQLAGAIEERMRVEVPVELLFGQTLGQLADWVDHTGLSPAPAATLDLEREATLPPDIVVHQRAPRGDDLVLTGATGLLGGHLLAALLHRSRRRVVCLVRARNEAHGRQRLEQTARRLGLTVPWNRVDVVVGDLAAPRLGLGAAAFDALAGRAWRIVHCGARVDWAARFEDLRAPNVGGTIEVVRLAALGGGVPVHHVSSLGVYPLGLSRRAAFDEDEPVSEGERLRVPYFQSKWAAERVLEHARALGIPVGVYRPGFITGHSQTGAELAPRDQLFAAFVAGVVRMGSVPAVDKALDVVPVDFVAEAIVALALRSGPPGRHCLLNPQPLPQSRFYELLRRHGYRLAPLSYPRWREAVLRLPRQDAECALTRFALYYRTITPQVMRRLEASMATRIPVDDRGTRGTLDALGIDCPPFDEPLVDTYLRALTEQGLLPSPRVEVVATPAASPSTSPATLLSMDALAAPWQPHLPPEQARIVRLYEQAKRRQWDADERLPWSMELDPEDPCALPDESIPIWGSPLWKSLGPADRCTVRRHYQAWQLSQFLAGEQGAMLCAGKLVQQAPSASARLFCATQLVDEARHVEIFARLLSEKIGLHHEVCPPLSALLDDVLHHRSWDMTALGMQVLVEGLGLAVFSMIRDRTQHPLIAAAHAYVAQDEARHVGFGKIQLEAHYRHLGRAELEQREQFVVEASYLLRDRFLARDLWTYLDLPVDRCVRWIEDTGTMHRYRASLFRRIVPIVRAIGLWGPTVRDAYARMGILSFAQVPLESLIAEDEHAAQQIGTRLARS